MWNQDTQTEEIDCDRIDQNLIDENENTIKIIWGRGSRFTREENKNYKQGRYQQTKKIRKKRKIHVKGLKDKGKSVKKEKKVKEEKTEKKKPRIISEVVFKVPAVPKLKLMCKIPLEKINLPQQYIQSTSGTSREQMVMKVTPTAYKTNKERVEKVKRTLIEIDLPPPPSIRRDYMDIRRVEEILREMKEVPRLLSPIRDRKKEERRKDKMLELFGSSPESEGTEALPILQDFEVAKTPEYITNFDWTDPLGLKKT